MPLQEFVFSLETAQLVVESLSILALLPVCRKTVLAEDAVVPHGDSKHCCGSRGSFAPPEPDRLKEACQEARLRHLADCAGGFHVNLKYKGRTGRRQGKSRDARGGEPTSYTGGAEQTALPGRAETERSFGPAVFRVKFL